MYEVPPLRRFGLHQDMRYVPPCCCVDAAPPQWGIGTNKKTHVDIGPERFSRQRQISSADLGRARVKSS